jgi:hypothetical protein
MKRNLLLGGLLGSYCFGAVFDTIPSDYVAPQAGTHVMSINVLDRSSIGPYAKGKKLTNDSIVQKTYYLRYNYGSSFLGYTTSYGVALPFTKVQTKGATLENALGEKSTGWSDFVLSSTMWLLNDREKREYLGVTFLLVTPSGNYDKSQILNTSENRYKYILNMGYIKPLSEKLILELSPELAFYGDNKTSTSTMKQKPSFALNTNLRYRFNKTYEIFGGYQYSYNSETSINGTEQNNQHSSNKYSLGGFYYTKKHHQFMVRYAKESTKDFGMQIEDELLLRYRWWF